MKITVTQEDIENGSPSEWDACPVALALARATGKKWLVCPTRFKLPAPDNYGNGPPMSYEVSTFVEAFDSGKPVEPFTFEFDVEDT